MQSSFCYSTELAKWRDANRKHKTVYDLDLSKNRIKWEKATQSKWTRLHFYKMPQTHAGKSKRKIQFLPSLIPSFPSPHLYLLYSSCWIYIIFWIDILKCTFHLADSVQLHRKMNTNIEESHTIRSVLFCFVLDGIATCKFDRKRENNTNMRRKKIQ